MKKSLKLNLDDLKVESFDATPAPDAQRGTVEGFITGICDETQGICTGNESCLALCTAYCAPQSIPCTIRALTCPPPSEQTCATNCYSGCQTCNTCPETCHSCVYYECYGTCEFQTQCWN